jgi:multidrug resistance efflux pump
VVAAVVAAGFASVVTLTLVVLAASYGARAWTRYRERPDTET